jgi:hypothetical protein
LRLSREDQCIYAPLKSGDGLDENITRLEQQLKECVRIVLLSAKI